MMDRLKKYSVYTLGFVLGLSWAGLSVLPNALPAWADENTYEAVTGESYSDYADHWDHIYSVPTYVYGKEPDAFLKANSSFLPKHGKAFDIAMGEGRNSVYLAKLGLEVEGIDISKVALTKAKKLAVEKKVLIKTIHGGLAHYQIPAGSYDVIINIQFLMRSLIPQIKKALRPGGVVVFESWTTDQIKNVQGQMLRKDYLLNPGELKSLFSEFEILAYRETNDGKDAVASLVARKPLAQ